MPSFKLPTYLPEFKGKHAIIKHRTKKKGGELHKVYLCYHRGGKYHDCANPLGRSWEGYSWKTK